MYTLGEAHGLSESSTIKQANDEFYVNHLATYSEYIDTNAGFCGDRSTLNNQSGAGTGTITTYYKGYLRMVRSTPSLLCENTSDLYTHTSSNKGNKALTYPIGLITMDEVILAGTGGGVFNGDFNYMLSSSNSYLQTGNIYWTMTPVGAYNPFGWTNWYASVFNISASGKIDDNGTTASYGVRPTINLRAGLKYTGNGTISSPFKLSES